MNITVLADNIGSGDLEGEWGFSVYVEYRGKKILLDTGASGLFLRNAEKLGISLKDADFGVLSHAHYDHSDGMRYFFEANREAPFYVRAECRENCHSGALPAPRYIGIQTGLLKTYADRIRYVSEPLTPLSDGIFLLAHTTPGLNRIGVRENMYQKNESGFIPDDFSHEQSIVFDTPQGLVVLNSCSHAGAHNIIQEVSAAFPGRTVYALLGGFHLFNKTEASVRRFASCLKETGIARLYTGHCTGETAFGILKEELGEAIQQFHAGMILSFPS